MAIRNPIILELMKNYVIKGCNEVRSLT